MNYDIVVPPFCIFLCDHEIVVAHAFDILIGMMFDILILFTYPSISSRPIRAEKFRLLLFWAIARTQNVPLLRLSTRRTVDSRAFDLIRLELNLSHS